MLPKQKRVDVVVVTVEKLCPKGTGHAKADIIAFDYSLWMSPLAFFLSVCVCVCVYVSSTTDVGQKLCCLVGVRHGGVAKMGSG